MKVRGNRIPSDIRFRGPVTRDGPCPCTASLPGGLGTSFTTGSSLFDVLFFCFQQWPRNTGWKSRTTSDKEKVNGKNHTRGGKCSQR